MKKNIMMRLASFLLVAVLISTSAISGTYAKYVTADTATDKARVAKWGVKIEAENNTLFTTDYKTHDANFTGEYSVSSATGDRDDVVAPGTNGQVTSIAISGTPEVAVEVKVESTVTLTNNWNVTDDKDTVDTADDVEIFYCPVVVTVGTNAVCGLDFNNAGDFADAIKAQIDAYSAKYEPNTDLSVVTNGTAFDISWSWPFDTDRHDDLAHGHTLKQLDKFDTALGDAAVAADLGLQIDLNISVTQVD